MAEANNVASVTDVKIDDIKGTEESQATSNEVPKQNGLSSDAYELAPSDKHWTTERDGAVKLHIGETQYDNQSPITVPQLFQSIVEKAGDFVALTVKREGEWKKWTYKEYFEDCKIAAKGFIKV